MTSKGMYMILTRFGNNVGSLFAKKTKRIRKKRSNKMTEKQAARATNDISLHNEIDWHTLA